MPSDLLDVAKRVVAWARPDEQVEVFASRSRGTAVRISGGDVEDFTSSAPAGIGVRVIVEGKEGFATAGTLDEAVAKETLEEARDNVRFAQADEFAGLAEPDAAPRLALDLYRESIESMTPEDKIAAARDLERRTLAADPRLRVRHANWGDSVSEQAIASTKGVESWAKRSSCSLVVSALADEDGQTQTGGGFTQARSPENLDPDEALDEAVRETLRMLGAKKPRSARMPAVLHRDVAAQFLGIVGGTLSGEAVLKGRSIFADRAGEDVGATCLTLIDDPTDPRSMAAWPDDDEGTASRRNVLFDEGVLRGFLHNTWTARKSGAVTTGSAVRSYMTTPAVGCRTLIVSPGDKNEEQLLQEMGDGIFVQSVVGLHSGVNPVSGDFSAGAAGLMVRGGQLAEPVQELTIASTIQRLLKEIAAVGNNLRWRGGSAIPSIALREVSVGGL